MSIEPMNVNSKTYLGSATTTPAEVLLAKLPGFDAVERIIVENLDSTNKLYIKTGGAGVTITALSSGNDAAEMTIVAPGKQIAMKKEKLHSSIAVVADGTISFTIQYGNGI